MKAELKLKCLNTDLLWAKGYHNLEIRNVKRIPANTNFLELQNYGSLIEQETVVDSNIITNPNRQKKKRFFVRTFSSHVCLALRKLNIDKHSQLSFKQRRSYVTFVHRRG